jgi:hypothetical protein
MIRLDIGRMRSGTAMCVCTVAFAEHDSSMISEIVAAPCLSFTVAPT